MGAKFDLTAVHEAARGQRITLDESRARNEVGRFIAKFIDAYPFAAEVLLALTTDDYVESVVLEPPHPGAYDVYALSVSTTVAQRHGVPACGWYLKLQLQDDLFGESVFLVSLHPLAHDIRRTGGWLRKEGKP